MNTNSTLTGDTVESNNLLSPQAHSKSTTVSPFPSLPGPDSEPRIEENLTLDANQEFHRVSTESLSRKLSSESNETNTPVDVKDDLDDELREEMERRNKIASENDNEDNPEKETKISDTPEATTVANDDQVVTESPVDTDIKTESEEPTQKKEEVSLVVNVECEDQSEPIKTTVEEDNNNTTTTTEEVTKQDIDHLRAPTDGNQADDNTIPPPTPEVIKKQREYKEKLLREWQEAKRTELNRMRDFRDAHIGREQDRVQRSFAAEDEHWQRQEERFLAMLRRISSARKICEELENDLIRSNKMVGRVASGLLEFKKLDIDSGTLQQAIIAQDILKKTTSQYLTEMKERVFMESVRQASSLAKLMSKSYAKIETPGVKVHKSVKAQREKVKDMWRQYEKALENRHTMEAVERTVKVDPFLACRNYERDLRILKRKEREYSQQMSKVFQEFRKTDASRLEATKAIMLDNLLAQKTVLEHTVKFTNEAIESVKAMDKDRDVCDFVCAADLLLLPRDTTTRREDSKNDLTISTVDLTKFDMPPPYRDPTTLDRLYQQELEKEGVIHRQGRFFKSSWVEMYGAISKSGFFHFFENIDATSPTNSILLHDCNVGRASDRSSDGDKLAFYIEQPSTGLFSFSSTSVYYFKVSDEKELSEWLSRATKHTKEAPPEIDLNSIPFDLEEERGDDEHENENVVVNDVVKDKANEEGNDKENDDNQEKSEEKKS